MSQDLDKAKNLFLKSLDAQFLGDLTQAKKYLNDALKLAPSRKSIINNLLIINFTLKDLKSIQNLVNHIISLDDNYKNLSDLGRVQILFLQKDYLKVIEISNEILKQNDVETLDQCYDLLIKSYFKIGDLNKLFKYLRLSLKMNLNHEQSLYNAGSILQYVSKPRAAIYFLKKSLKYRDNISYHSCLAQSYLKIKNFEEGFKYWESRLYLYNYNIEIINSIKSIKSIYELKDKKILIIFEQGLGDTLNFSRYVKLLKNYSSNIYFTVQDKLLEIFQNFDDTIKIISTNDSKTEEFDFKIPLVSLIKLLNQNYKNISYHQLHIPQIATPIDLKIGKYNIAYAHQGNSDYICDQFRSIPLNIFSRIFENKKANFFNLGKNEQFNNLNNLKDISHLNFLEISNFIKKVNLVISTDTVFVHLCGILNIKCILLLNKNAEWRWFNHSKKTVWYPSIRILKQSKIGNWDKEISTIKKFIKMKTQ